MNIDTGKKVVDLKKHERWLIAASAYQSIKYVVDILNEEKIVKGKFKLQYPKIIEVDEDTFYTCDFEDELLSEFLDKC